jgi:hypothetical protein
MFEKTKKMVFEKKTQFVTGATAAVMSVASSISQAALPAAVGTAFTDLLTDALALIDLAWTVAVPVTIGYIILGMFSRAARTAVS